MAAELPVVHLEIRHRGARFTPPAVATQDLLAQMSYAKAAMLVNNAN
jgi:hypothetical protein